jgi:hypothetical protein
MGTLTSTLIIVGVVALVMLVLTLALAWWLTR